MKNTTNASKMRLLQAMQSIAIIVVIAIIGFSMTACDTGDDNSGTVTDPYANAAKVPGVDFAAKLDWINQNAVGGGMYALELSQNITFNTPQVIEFTPSASQSVSIARNNQNDVITIILMKTAADVIIELLTNGAVFTLEKGVNFVIRNGVTLRGRTDNNNAVVVVKSGTTLTMESGSTIRDNTFNGNGGGVIIQTGGTFIMNGGTITNCNVSPGWGRSGGGVFARRESTFTMNGGTITNCSANNGGGVFIEGATFTMNSGEIIDNNSLQYLNASYDGGGGVYITNNYSPNVDGIFNMKGGTIANNNSHLDGGGVMAYAGSFTMTGGTISGNTAAGTGGGVYVSRSRFEKTGGIIYGENEGNNSNTANASTHQGHAVRKDGYSGGGRAKVDITHSAGRLYAGNASADNTDAGVWVKWD